MPSVTPTAPLTENARPPKESAENLAGSGIVGTIRPMPKADQLKTLIESFAASDDARFYRTALQLAADEARRGHGKLAQELRDTVDAARARGAMLPTAKRPI